ncbi:MAG: ATP-binding protein [Deltaproteobacteria bacterium]|nr:ATP-binding protein [Deltaproteobacteria bacterium]
MDKNIFIAKNPWRIGRLPPTPTLTRPIYEQVIELCHDPAVLLVFGPRRAGKTTLLRELARRLISTQKALPDQVFYLDLDTMDCADILSNVGSLLQFCEIDPVHPPQDLTYILIDEIQRLEDPGLLLKAIYDMELPIRVVVTGSSAFGLRVKVRQSLVGRSRSLFLWPLSPPEIPFNKEYIGWGGFPEVLLAKNDAQRQEYLANMWAAYVDREIGGFLKVQKMDRFRSFSELLAAQTGQLVNLNEFSNTLMVSRDTVSRYLAYLQESFLVRDLRPFTTNRRGELSKMPKIFFTDLGLLNLLQGQPANLMNIQRGPILENAVEITIRSFGGDLYFWRTDRGAEVDFVWQNHGKLVPIEVKSAAISRPTVSRGYRNFLKIYKPEKGILVNETLDSEVKVEDTLIRFIPFKSFVGFLAG